MDFLIKNEIPCAGITFLLHEEYSEGLGNSTYHIEHSRSKSMLQKYWPIGLCLKNILPDVLMKKYITDGEGNFFDSAKVQ